MTNLTQESKCYSAGLKMLMRREHSRLELFQKLQTKGFDVDVVNDSISKLVEQNYQSDNRFSEEFIQMRFNQGKGPVKIASDLKMRGINTFDLSVFVWFQLGFSLALVWVQLSFGLVAVGFVLVWAGFCV